MKEKLPHVPSRTPEALEVSQPHHRRPAASRSANEILASMLVNQKCVSQEQHSKKIKQLIV